MRIWGVDYDTKKITVVQFVDGQFDCYWMLPTPDVQKKRGFEERWDAIREMTRRILWEHTKSKTLPDWVYIEDVVAVHNPKVQTQMAFIAGTLAVYCMERDVGLTFVDISTWKKSTVGRGNADKDQVKKWAIKIIGMSEKLPQDVYDATCLAFYGSRNVGDHIGGDDE